MKKTILIIGLIIFSALTYAQNRYFTVEGQRYYKVFDSEFRLNNGRMDDSQALRLIRIIERNYEKSIIDREVLAVWNDIGDMYEGGQYHGKLVMQIFHLYLNIAFDKYHNSSLNFNGNISRFSSGDGDIIPNYAQASAYAKFYSNTELGNTGKKEYRLSWKTRYRILPEISNASNYYIHNSSSQKEFCYDSEDGKKYAQNFITRNMVYMSAYNSSNNIEEIISHIFKTVRPNDNIFKNGEYDKTLIKILKQYNTTKNKFGETVAKTFYNKLSSLLYEYIYGVEKKRVFLNTANQLGVKVKIQSNSKKAF